MSRVYLIFLIVLHYTPGQFQNLSGEVFEDISLVDQDIYDNVLSVGAFLEVPFNSSIRELVSSLDEFEDLVLSPFLPLMPLVPPIIEYFKSKSRNLILCDDNWKNDLRFF